MRALWVGPEAARALATGGRGSVEIALHPGGYVRLGDDWILVAIARAPRGPLSILVGGLARRPLRPWTPAVADAGTLTIGELRIVVDEPTPSPASFPLRGGAPMALTHAPPPDRADPLAAAPVPPPAPLAAGLIPSALPAALCPPAPLAAGLIPSALPAALRPPVPAAAGPTPFPLPSGRPAALAAALDAAPPPPPELARGLAALRAGALDDAVARLAGRGDGLTPAGDDVLAGFAAWGGTPLAALAAGRASPLGLAYLRCAERGELPEPVARVLEAIRGGDAVLARARARGLARWGASSGAAMLWGIAAAATGACA